MLGKKLVVIEIPSEKLFIGLSFLSSEINPKIIQLEFNKLMIVQYRKGRPIEVLIYLL